jgi:hypothetical protein
MAMKETLMVFSLVLCLGLGFVQESHAAFYKYMDKNGIECFSDNLQAVPEQYRSNCVIVESDGENDKTKIAVPAAGQVEVETALSPTEAKSEADHPRPLSTRLLISAAVSVSAFLIFILISRQPELKDNKKVLSVVRTVLTGIVSLYLIIAHGGDVRTVFGAAGRAVQEAQHHSAEKGKKAARAIKQMNAMFDDMQNAQAAQESSTAPAETEK